MDPVDLIPNGAWTRDTSTCTRHLWIGSRLSRRIGVPTGESGSKDRVAGLGRDVCRDMESRPRRVAPRAFMIWCLSRSDREMQVRVKGLPRYLCLVML